MLDKEELKSQVAVSSVAEEAEVKTVLAAPEIQPMPAKEDVAAPEIQPRSEEHTSELQSQR